MNLRSLSILAAGLLVSVSTGALTAQAADMPAPAANLWSGFYLGAQAGYLQGTGSNTDICATDGTDRMCFGDDGFDFGDTNADGITAGGYLGYNYQIDSIVMGLEGDFNWDNAQGDSGSSIFLGPYSYSSSLNWDASIRARLGFVVDERALLYVTGGPSWLNMDVNADYCGLINSPGNTNCGDSNTNFGWQLGAGAEYMITDHLSMKAEFLHGWYGDVDSNIFTVSDAGNKFKIYAKEDLQTNVVRAGIAYHFGGF